MAGDFTLTTHLNPTTGGTNLTVHYMPSLLAKNIYADILGILVSEVSKKVIENNGTEMVNDIMKNYDSIRENILDCVTSNIDVLIANLNTLEDDFNHPDRYCKCDYKFPHKDGTMKHTTLRSPWDKEPMTNFEYMEKRSEILDAWAKSLPLENYNQARHVK